MTQPTPIAVMLSGGGRTLVNLLENIDAGRLNARVVLVVASKECGGAERARERGIPTRVMPGQIPEDELRRVLAQSGAAWVVLAGYLKKVSIPREYAGRVVNIHPALLPAFGGAGMYGMRVHEAVVRAGVRITGATVHLCDDEYDRGPILEQEAVRVEPTDSPADVAAKVFAAECRVYPRALAALFAKEQPR